MLRIVGGLGVGVIAAMATVFVVEYLGHQVYPLPDGMDAYDPDQVGDYVATASIGAKLFVVAAWGIGTFLGGVVARLIARRGWAAWPIAGVIVLAGIANSIMIPSPLWMKIAAVAVPLFGGWLAARLPLRSGEVRDAAL